MTTLKQYQKSLVESFNKNKVKTHAGKYHEWFYKKAETFTDIDKDESRRLARIYKCKVKECFYNSWNINTTHPSYKYYEGYVYAHGIPISHSWYFGIEIPRSFSKVHNGSIVESAFRYFMATN
jgi:hypothetical protein